MIEAARSKGLDRIAIAYTASAWVVVQAAAIAARAYAWPQWALQLMILAALFGLPVGLIAAWTRGVRANAGGALKPSRAEWHVLATLAVGAFVLGGIVLWTFWSRWKRHAGLPFRALGGIPCFFPAPRENRSVRRRRWVSRERLACRLAASPDGFA